MMGLPVVQGGSGKLATATALALFLAACSSDIGQNAPDEVSVAPQAVSNYQVVTSADDAEEDNASGTTVTNSSILDLGTQTVGVRFQQVVIPQGAQVNSAYLEFKGSVDATDFADFVIYGHASDDSPTFVAGSGSRDISARAKTINAKVWTPAARPAGDVYQPDVTAIVQGLVIRSGWRSGNAMSFMISGSGQRRVGAFDAGTGNGPKLVVTYDAPPPPPPPANNCYTTGTYAATLTEPQRTVTSLYNSYRGFTQSTRIDASKLTVQRNNVRGTGGETALVIQNNASAGRICLRGGTYNPNVAEDASWEPDYHEDTSILVYNSPNLTIENVAIYRGADAFTLKEGNPNATIRDSYVYRAGDDVVENDRRSTNMVVDNILVDSAYTGFSCQHEVPFNSTRVEWTIKNSLIALRRENGAVTGQKPIKLWKFNKGKYPTSDGRTNCRVTFQDNVILITRPTSEMVIDPGTYKLLKSPGSPEYVSDSPMRYEACAGHQNTIVYTGPTGGSYYDQLQSEVDRHPECFKLTTDYNVWKNARADWFSRHSNFTAKYGDETGKFINYETN